MQRRRAVNLNGKCFYFFPCSPYVAVSVRVSFAIRRSFACGEGALAATAAAAAAAAARCIFNLVIKILSVVVMVCLLCCLFCVILALLLLYYSRRVIAGVVGTYLL